MGQKLLSFSADHDACGVGFIAQLGSSGTHEVVARALCSLARLTHRGGVDADGRSGDGAGLLTAIPRRFFRQAASALGIPLPQNFGLGMIFLAPARERATVLIVEAAATSLGLCCLGWREVPTDATIIGPRSSESQPCIRQCFFAAQDPDANLEGLLFRMRKQLEASTPDLYFCSLSSHTVVYKGLVTPEQLPAFYLDLAAPEFESPFAIFHQRYSTNTQPSWALAQPFRFAAHNGEINTVSANRRWLRAREPQLRKSLFLPDTCSLLEAGMSDSASFDNALELSLAQGRPLVEAMARLLPPAWEHDQHIEECLRRWFEHSRREQESWDGPAALVFTDGQTVGAKLDRNGLRPLRYTLTSDGLVSVGSEVGISDFGGKQVIERQRLGPGEMLLADPTRGILFRPSEIWGLLEKSSARGSLPPIAITPEPTVAIGSAEPNRMLAAMGWTEDQYRMLFQPLVKQGQEALWSMGDDAPPASLSGFHRPLWDHCKQRFAQVTNPPIDPLREAHVMSLEVCLGKRIVIPSPLLDSAQLKKLGDGLGPVRSLDFTFEVRSGVEGARAALEGVGMQARVAAGSSGILLLSDRGVNEQRAALPALLALSAAWAAVTDEGGWDLPVIVETGQVVETHSLALLVASGASAIYPYLALEMAAREGPGGAERYRAGVDW